MIIIFIENHKPYIFFFRIVGDEFEKSPSRQIGMHCEMLFDYFS